MWELEKDIPQHIIEYEESATTEVEEVSSRNVGQTATILNVANSTTKLQANKAKTDRVVVNKDDG